jgi:hypothetical protein
MNTNILQKCLDELNKADFRKDYVIGMLETFIEINGSKITPTIKYAHDIKETIAPIIPEEGSELADAYANGRIGRIS